MGIGLYVALNKKVVIDIVLLSCVFSVADFVHWCYFRGSGPLLIAMLL